MYTLKRKCFFVIILLFFFSLKYNISILYTIIHTIFDFSKQTIRNDKSIILFLPFGLRYTYTHHLTHTLLAGIISATVRSTQKITPFFFFFKILNSIIIIYNHVQSLFCVYEYLFLLVSF